MKRLGRSHTYPTLIGVVIGLLIAGTVVPLVGGSRSDLVVGTARSGSGSGTSFGDAGSGYGSAAASTAASNGSGAGGSEAVPQGGSASRSAAAGTGPGSRPAGTTGSAAGGGAAATGPSANGGAPTASGSALGATDVGVTATTVKVGFLILDVGGLGNMGVNVGVNDAQEQAIYQSYVDDLNARGGIAGRKIVPYYVKYNVLSSSTGDQGQYTGPEACRTLTEGDQVFAVVGYLDATDIVCVTRDHQTLMLTTQQSVTEDMFNQSAGRLLSLFPRAGRMMDNWVSQLDRAGYLTGKKVGIVDGATWDPTFSGAQDLAAALKRAGHTVTRITQFSGDTSQTSAQAPIEASQQAAAGTQVVMLMTPLVSSEEFVQDAQNQGYNFQYSTSDFAAMGSDPSAQMPKGFDGSLSVTSIGLGGFQDRNGWSEPAQGQYCNQTYQRIAKAPALAAGTNAYGLGMLICDSTYFFAKVAAAAGPNLTRATAAAAASRLGSFGPSAYMQGGSYGPNKPDYVDYFRVERYDYSCNCYHPDGPFTPGTS